MHSTQGTKQGQEVDTLNGYLSPKVLQGVGLLLLVGAAVFWAVTGRESVLVMGAAMSLIGLGAYKGAADAIFNNDPKPGTPISRTSDSQPGNEGAE